MYSGTNLLGVLKHVAVMEAVYLGATFSRPVPHEGWLILDFELPCPDMWATAEESRDRIVEYYKRVWANSDATVAEFDLDATGHVPHWPSDRNEVTLHHMLMRMISETSRHAGHADICREVIDNSIGVHETDPFVPSADPAWYEEYRARLDRAAGEADSRAHQL